MTFHQLFRGATGNEPYPYQARLAEAEPYPSLLSIPTGLGKTAAVVLSWLWRRRFGPPELRQTTPRRLVYCLPMRVLVEQTRDSAITWLRRLGLLGGAAQIGPDGELISYALHGGADAPDAIRVYLLMGGELDRDWDAYPERDAILVGTQDMLLSRALNRGYAMSRFRWPLQFGLLNSDCLWVMDEIQLMGSGLATTTQLQAFRRLLGTALPTRSLWMSATMRPDWLATVDLRPALDAAGMIELGPDDLDREDVRRRRDAQKALTDAGFEASRDGRAEAELALERHRPGERTLVVVNTVRRAQSVHAALAKIAARRPIPPDLVLLHSRFRPPDRDRELQRLLARPAPQGTIAVATQVIEAGVDVSAAVLLTDVAPWASLVQRFGRCNRDGLTQSAEVIWIGLRPDAGAAAPYTLEDLDDAQRRVRQLSSASSPALPAVDAPFVPRHVLRRRDLVDLFDTTPDLAGADVDVSRFIRETDDHDIQLFWRELPDGRPDHTAAAPARDELCSVSLGDYRRFRPAAAWRWDHLEGAWVAVSARDVYPGLVLMLDVGAGGYSPERGWTGDQRHIPTRIAVAPSGADGNDNDPWSASSRWQSLAEHTQRTVAELERLLAALPAAPPEWVAALQHATRWHDAGKAHPEFQAAMLGDPLGADPGTIWAKSARPPADVRNRRRGFRHELASGLAMLLAGLPDLAAYLAAAHHGKIGLSIRSLPHESHPPDPCRRFARGIWDGDILPSTELGEGHTMPATILDLSFMELGEGAHGPSWLARMLVLRDRPDLGPFRLAWLAGLLRVCDWRASQIADATEGVNP